MKKHINNIDREWAADHFGHELWEVVDLIGPNSAEALKLMNILADKGSALSMVYIGDTHANGRGVERNIDLGIQWYRRSAEAGSIEGAFRLSKHLWSKNKYNESIEVLKKIAASGFSPAAFIIGSTYFNGDNVEKNNIEAVKYWKLAEHNGHLLAKRSLSIYLRSGEEGIFGRVKGYIKLFAMLPESVTVSANNPSSDRLLGWHEFSIKDYFPNANLL
jgi:TPR repeat protein